MCESWVIKLKMNKINKNNLLIVKIDKSMVCQVSNIASSTLGSSFIRGYIK